MNNAQVIEFESKLPASLKHGCEVRFWREDHGHWVCYEIRGELHKSPVPGKIEVTRLNSTHDVEINVRAIANALPASWRASHTNPATAKRAMAVA